MGEIRLYRQMYHFKFNGSGSTQSQELFNVHSLSASTKIHGTTGDTFVESNLEIFNESTGVYYVDLNPVYYAADLTYDLNWKVEYFENVPAKTLPTRFRLNPTIIGHKLEVEILSSC